MLRANRALRPVCSAPLRNPGEPPMAMLALPLHEPRRAIRHLTCDRRIHKLCRHLRMCGGDIRLTYYHEAPGTIGATATMHPVLDRSAPHVTSFAPPIKDLATPSRHRRTETLVNKLCRYLRMRRCEISLAHDRPSAAAVRTPWHTQYCPRGGIPDMPFIALPGNLARSTYHTRVPILGVLHQREKLRMRRRDVIKSNKQFLVATIRTIATSRTIENGRLPLMAPLASPPHLPATADRQGLGQAFVHKLRCQIGTNRRQIIHPYRHPSRQTNTSHITLPRHIM